jgi:hypothetical protein
MGPLAILLGIAILALLAGAGGDSKNGGDGPLPVPPGPVPPDPAPIPPGPGPVPFDDSAWFAEPSGGWRCGLTGEMVSVVTPGHVVAALAVLVGAPFVGVPTDKASSMAFLVSPTGVLAIKKWQATARSLGLGALNGAPPSYVDGVVGACTLSSIRAALQRVRAGTWFKSNPAALPAYNPP